MKRPVLFAAPILIFDLADPSLGQPGSWRHQREYLPPTNSVRQAQEEFNRTFPGFRVEPITLVIQSTDGVGRSPTPRSRRFASRHGYSGFTEPQNDRRTCGRTAAQPRRRVERPHPSG